MFIEIDDLYNEELASQYTSIESIKDRIEEFNPNVDDPTELVTLNKKARLLLSEVGGSTQFLFHTYRKEISYAINSTANGERIEYTREAIKFMLMDLRGN